MILFGILEIKIRLLTIKAQVKEVFLNDGKLKAYGKYKKLTNSDLTTCVNVVKQWVEEWS